MQPVITPSYLNPQTEGKRARSARSTHYLFPKIQSRVKATRLRLVKNSEKYGLVESNTVSICRDPLLKECLINSCITLNSAPTLLRRVEYVCRKVCQPMHFWILRVAATGR